MTALEFRRLGPLGHRERRTLIRRVLAVNPNVTCKHTHDEMARIIKALFSLPGDVHGCVVEAGCFKGGSTCKLSIAAQAVGRQLVVFDSFEGLPDAVEMQQPGFVQGLYAGDPGEVQKNVGKFGEIEVCTFIKGWFKDTMPHFNRPVALAFLDVDLAASTETCLRHLYPLLIPGGVIFSHDGHFPLCVDVFRDKDLWKSIGGPPPVFEGLGTQKMISITKPATGVEKEAS